MAGTELHGALDGLLARARAAGAVREGIGAAELIALLKGLLQAVHDSADPELPSGCSPSCATAFARPVRDVGVSAVS